MIRNKIVFQFPPPNADGLMSFALFAGNTLKVVHLGCNDWRADEANVVDLRDIAARLVILDENLYVLYILEFHIAQIYRISTLQLLLGKATSRHRCKIVTLS